MAIKNLKQFLVQATKLPAAIEGKLPAGAPQISAKLVDAANKLPDMPDFPIDIPDLPDIPELPAGPGGLSKGRGGVRATTVRAPAPMGATVARRGML